MDEEISIIDSKTRNEKIKIFFSQNKKFLIFLILIIISIIISFYSFQIYEDKQKTKISEIYNSTIIEYKKVDQIKTISALKNLIDEKDSTYSPLALYFLIDNNLIDDIDEMNNLFDILINKTSLENEIKNLLIYKKGLFNADTADENTLLNILKPIINSESVWKSHALYLIAEYFYAKKEKQKAKEFFTQILNLDDVNGDILKEAQKRISRDLSE